MVLKPRIPAPEWDGRDNPSVAGKCMSFPVTKDRDPWFEEMDEAIAICNGDIDGIICPLRAPCLMFALINNEADGVWGGMYPHDRRRLRYLRRRNPRQAYTWEPPTPVDDEAYREDQEHLSEAA